MRFKRFDGGGLLIQYKKVGLTYISASLSLLSNNMTPPKSIDKFSLSY